MSDKRGAFFDYDIGTKYHVTYRWKNSTKEHEFEGIYRGVKESPAQSLDLHCFDLGSGASMYIGEARIVEAEKL